MNLKELYQELILDHGRHPRSFGCLDEPCCVKEGYNPLCGDRLRLSVKLENQTVADALFDGEGCAISMASRNKCCRRTVLGRFSNRFGTPKPPPNR